MAARRIAVLVALAAVVPLMGGCSDEPRYFGPAHVESNAVHPHHTTEEADAGASIVNHVATELYGPIAADAKDGNVAYSPLSIAVALGMTRAGAQGESADQLDAFFGSPADLHRSLNGAAASAQDLAGPVQLANGEMGEIELANANALWGQSGVEWRAPFLDELRTSYDASMWTADYAGDPERARADINDWVAEHTREHIPQLLPQGSIDEATRLVLTNALFFKAPWPEELDPARDHAFTRLDGSNVQAPMLTTSVDGYQEGDGWQAATIPYAGGKLGLTLLVPDEGKLDEVEGQLDDDLLHQVLTGGDGAVDVTFPKIDLDQRAPIGDVLKGLGVTAPFTTDTDFEPMTDDPDAQPLTLADVVHQATVTVDEHGTEAAAATAATFETTSAHVPDRQLVVDRPFLFAIADLTTGTPLFVGRVTDPTAK